MLNYDVIINNLIEELKIENESDLSRLMGMSRQSLQNHKARNTIPYKQIIYLCLTNKIDINKIFNNEDNKKTISNHIQKIENQNGLNIQGKNNQVSNIKTDSKKLEIIEKIEKLPPKRQDYYYHVISAEILNLED
ncbi:helix-turn-helix domain-containing protein [Arcobacter aquimarinus]|uniref:Bacteriophage CI repressor N-terminal domain-containing protein n=1 Tax=Arcobacter aquimarinus TaxID=1315211 RepID=A0AAE7E0I8_9BACT|nr:helix-turn-helix domain-containing protein [Arcobacter aquimarinus]QKE26063.1 hypothetical protein AAQM_1314 [Arcobacter aquimarinus]